MINLLVPRNIEGRKEKLKQINTNMLSQEVIDGDLVLDDSYMEVDPKFIKLKKVNGYIWLYGGQWTEIPEWLKDVEISGDFDCGGNNLTTLKNCPQKIGGWFNCSYNKLISLYGCSENVEGNFWCKDNNVKLELPGYVNLKGNFFK